MKERHSKERTKTALFERTSFERKKWILKERYSNKRPRPNVVIKIFKSFLFLLISIFKKNANFVLSVMGVKGYHYHKRSTLFEKFCHFFSCFGPVHDIFAYLKRNLAKNVDPPPPPSLTLTLPGFSFVDCHFQSVLWSLKGWQLFPHCGGEKGVDSLAC